MWDLIKKFFCLGMGVSYGEDPDAEARRSARIRAAQQAERERQREIMERENQELDPEWAKRPGEPER